MSLSEQTPRVDATLLTATDAIAFAYPFADADELLVVSDERGVLTRVTHYTVAGEGEAAGGTVTMVGGTVGEKITIVRNTPISQTLTLRINGKYFVTDVTAALDKLTKILQEVDEELARCLQTSVSDGTALELPDAADRLGKLLRFDSTGTSLLAVTELGDWKGDWVTATDYVNYDIFRDASTASVYYVLTAHTSTSIAADLTSGKISEVIDGSAITDAQAAAEAAQAAAEAAQALAEAAQALAEAALDSFTDQYLGAFASAPTTDNDGDPLTDGDLYYNTVSSAAFVWSSGVWNELGNFLFSDPSSSPAWEREILNAQLNNRSTANLDRLFAKIWKMRTDELAFYDNGIQPTVDEKQMFIAITGDSYGFKMTNPLSQSLVRNLTGQKTFRYPFYGPGQVRDGALIRNDGDFAYSAGVTHYTKNSGGANGRVASPDYSLWVSGCYWSVPSGESVDFYLQGDELFDASVIKVYAVQESGGGTFKVELSTTAVASGFADEVTGIDTNGATNALVTTINKTAGSYAVRVTATAGTVKILGCLAYRDDIPQVIVTDWSVSSLTPSLSFGVVNDTIMATILADIQPDLLTIGFADNGTEQPDGMDDVNDWVTLAGTKHTILALGPNPNSLGPNATLKATNDAMAEKAQDYGWLFYGQFYQFGEDVANVTAGELGDGTSSHPSYMGSSYLAAMFCKEAGLPSPFFSLPIPFELEDNGQTLVVPIRKKIEFRDAISGTVMARLGSDTEGVTNEIVDITPRPNTGGLNGLSLNPTVGGTDRVSATPPFSVTSDFTFVMLADLNQAASNGTGALLHVTSGNVVDLLNTTPSTIGGFTIGLKPNSQAPTGYTGYRLILNSGDNVTNGSYFDFRTTKQYGLRQIAITYNNSTGAVKLLIDGVEEYTGTITTNAWANLSLINLRLLNDTSANIRETSGKLYYVGLYDAVLTDAEILGIYRDPARLGESANCKLAYTFEDRQGSTVLDQSGNDADGTITGATWQWLTQRHDLTIKNNAAATTLGTVTDKVEIFDRDGVSLGFVPIYDSIT